MKIAANIAGVLLGLAFIAASSMVLFHLVDMPPLPEGPARSFMDALGPTGYMTMIKICEMAGGILVMIPLTRNFGLLILGPIIINILAFHIFIEKGEGLLDPMLIVICLSAAFLLWVGREKFIALKN